MNSENVIRGVYDSDNHDTACNLRALACALCVVFAALTFLLSPTQALAADEPHGQVLRVLLNAYHATVEESWFSGGGDPDPNDAILADLEACNDPEDYESFMTWYATQDGSEDSYMDLKYFADWDDHRALKAWNKYMLWLSEQMPAYDAQVYTQNYTRYIVSGSWVYDAGTSAISRLILPIEDNPYLYTVKQGYTPSDVNGDGVIVDGDYYPSFLNVNYWYSNMMEYFDFPSIERLDRIRWVYDPDMKDYYMQGLFVYSDPEIQSEWVDIYVKYLGGAGLVEGSPFIDQSNSPILRQYVRTYGDNLNISGVMAMMSQSNRLLSLRALGEYFHVLTNYKYTNFSYVIGGIYTGEYAHVNTNYFCNVDKDMYNQNGQILIKWDYGWQLGGSKPGYINAIPASMIYMRYPEAFAAGQVVPVSSDYTYSGNTFLTYGTLKMETLFSTASENHWNTSLVIMGDDYEVTRNDEVISGGGSGGSVDDAINDGSLGTGEGSGTVLVERPLLFRKFPFSIPFDLSDILAGFKAAPRAPVFIFPFSAFGGGVDATLDFSAFDEVARVVRIGELVLFVFALIASGSKMLGFSFGGGD